MLGKRRTNNNNNQPPAAKAAKTDENHELRATSIEDLPVEMLTALASYLPPKELHAFGLTCKAYSNLVFPKENENALKSQSGLGECGIDVAIHPNGVTAADARLARTTFLQNTNNQWKEVQYIKQKWPQLQRNVNAAIREISCPAATLKAYQEINELLDDANAVVIESAIDLNQDTLNLSKKGLTRFPISVLDANQDYWAALRVLMLSHNQLSGEIPVNFGNLRNLTQLYLDNNQLSGEIPESLSHLQNLQWLFLYKNQLSGMIPESLGDLKNLKWLFLHHNQLSGEIPGSLGSLLNLTILHLSSNQISGRIPASLGNLPNLEYLNLKNNQISGEIPESFKNLRRLRTLHLHNNQLRGEIPESLGNLLNLEYLNLHNNQFRGTIPARLVARYGEKWKQKIIQTQQPQARAVRRFAP